MLTNSFRKILAFSVCASLLISCTEEKPNRSIDRPSLRTTQAPISIVAKGGDKVTYGDTLHFKVEAVNPTAVITEIKVSLAETRKLLAGNADGYFSIPSTSTGGGSVKLRVEATFEDGNTSMRYKDFKVLAPEPPRNWGLEVVNRYPHDKGAFTQGLLFHNGFLYEGTGNIGESRIRKVVLQTGEVLQERANKPDIFGEGITIFGDKLYQVTYKTARGFVYNVDDFEQIGEFSYNSFTGEGWGLTHNDTALILSDGSSYLHFMDPESFTETGRISVFDHKGEVTRLNELEYNDGVIYANIYTAAEIIAIDAKTGIVLHRYSARGMVDKSETTPEMDVLNGIAINPANGNLLITGKYWKTLYEVRPALLP